MSPSERGRWRLLALALSGLFLLLRPGASRAQVPEYALKAEFLERFTRFVEWPVASPAGAPFVLGVYGSNPFGGYLAEIAASRRIKGRPAEVRLVSRPEDTERCDLLFIPASERRAIASVLAHTASRPVLTVSEVEGAAERGVLINFYVSDANLRFEINDAAVRKSGLSFSSRLLKLARVLNLERSE